MDCVDQEQARNMQRRVVCIEDEPEMIDLMSLIVARQGFEFIGARGGLTGMETVRQTMPDLILLDLMMSDVDGWEVFDSLRADPETGAIPIIIVTARGQQDERLVEMMANHADNLVTKPFAPAELIQAIDRTLKSS